MSNPKFKTSIGTKILKWDAELHCPREDPRDWSDEEVSQTLPYKMLRAVSATKAGGRGVPTHLQGKTLHLTPERVILAAARRVLNESWRVAGFKKSKKGVTRLCRCPSLDLFRYGCQCGGRRRNPRWRPIGWLPGMCGCGQPSNVCPCECGGSDSLCLCRRNVDKHPLCPYCASFLGSDEIDDDPTCPSCKAPLKTCCLTEWEEAEHLPSPKEGVTHPPFPKSCHCPSLDLFRYGCQCGGRRSNPKWDEELDCPSEDPRDWSDEEVLQTPVYRMIRKMNTTFVNGKKTYPSDSAVLPVVRHALNETWEICLGAGFKKSKKGGTHLCRCPSLDLFRYGCQCGGRRRNPTPRCKACGLKRYDPGRRRNLRRNRRNPYRRRKNPLWFNMICDFCGKSGITHIHTTLPMQMGGKTRTQHATCKDCSEAILSKNIRKLITDMVDKMPASIPRRGMRTLLRKIITQFLNNIINTRALTNEDTYDMHALRQADKGIHCSIRSGHPLLGQCQHLAFFEVLSGSGGRDPSRWLPSCSVCAVDFLGFDTFEEALASKDMRSI